MLLSDDKKRYGMKEGGEFPDLNKDGEVTYADVLLGKGVRQEKAIGGIIGRLANKVIKKSPTKEMGAKTARTEAEASLLTEMSDNANKLKQRGFSDERIEELLEEAYDLGEPNELMKALEQPIIRETKAQGGSMNALMDKQNTEQKDGNVDEQLSMLMGPQQNTMMEEMSIDEEPMESDSEMEDNYLDFIIDEALSEEEEEMLMSKLEQDEQLSMLFDKVIEVASEFAGSGPVEGPGSGVSDSIPARLSDGEFVFTAKAVEEIGADNLMAMMKDAEMKADERQGLAEGGQPEEEETVVMPVEQPAMQQDIRVTKTTVGAEASQQEVNDLVDEEVKKSMLRGSRNLG